VSFGAPEPIALPNNAATDSTQQGFPSGVSCGVGGCTVVGTYVTSGGTWAAFTATPGPSGAWTAAAVPAPSGAVDDSILNTISCPSTGPCEAVGNYADSSGYQQAWAVQVNGGVAGTAQPIALYPGPTSDVDTAPAVTVLRAGRPGLAAVSCPSAGVCTAVGLIGTSGTSPAGAMAVPITAGVPGQFTEWPGSDASTAPDLQGVWSADANDCEATGLQATVDPDASVPAVPIVASETGGAWSAPATLQGVSSPAGGITVANAEAMACTSNGVCVSGALLLSLGTGTVSSYFAYSALPPTITTTSLPAATVGQPYSATLQSSGGIGTGSWSVSEGSLPTGLTLNSTTGVISGTPTASGQGGFIVTATNAGPPMLSSTEGLSITVSPAADSVKVVASLKIGSARVSGDIVTAKLSCSGTRCGGKFKLTGIEHLHNGVPKAVVARAPSRKKKKPKPRTITLASGSYSVNVCSTKTIKIKLNHNAEKLLRKLHKISAQLTLTPTGAKTPALVKKLTFKSKR
jgi:hypothetical protein